MQTLIDFKYYSDNNHINQHRNPAYYELEWDRRQSAVQSDANGGGDEHTESGNGNTGSGPGHSFQSLLSWRGATRDGAAAARQCRARTQLQVTDYLNVKSRVSAQTRPYFWLREQPNKSFNVC